MKHLLQCIPLISKQLAWQIWPNDPVSENLVLIEDFLIDVVVFFIPQAISSARFPAGPNSTELLKQVSGIDIYIGGHSHQDRPACIGQTCFARKRTTMELTVVGWI